MGGVGDGAIHCGEPGNTATFAAAKIVDGVPTQEMMAPLVKQAVDAQ